MEEKIIAFAAGKSGGHIIPCIHIAQQKKIENPNYKTIFFTTRLLLDKKIISQYSHINSHVPVALSQLPSSLLYFPLFFWQVCTSFFKALITLIENRPLELITTGGITAIPISMAAWLLRIPVKIYVLDSKPGKAIRFLLPFATAVYYCFNETKKWLPSKKTFSTPYPSGYSKEHYIKSCAHARLTLGLNPHKKTMLVLGGSQGSIFINNAIAQWIQQSSASFSNFQIIHQIGGHDGRPWNTIYLKYSIPAYVFDYRSNLANIYAAADLIICRAGAGTLFEAHAFGKKCIVIPLETQQNNHQVDNAYAIANQFPNQFTVVRQQSIEQDPHLFFAHLDTLLAQDNLNARTSESLTI